MATGLEQARLIELPTFGDDRGILTVGEGGRNVPFEIKRVYYLYELPRKSHRGGHAHKLHEELVLPLAGSFDVTLDDGIEQKTFHLNQRNVGLLMPTMVWHELDNFSPDALCMVLASRHHDEEDYFHDKKKFYKALRETRNRCTPISYSPSCEA